MRIFASIFALTATLAAVSVPAAGRSGGSRSRASGSPAHHSSRYCISCARYPSGRIKPGQHVNSSPGPRLAKGGSGITTDSQSSVTHPSSGVRSIGVVAGSTASSQVPAMGPRTASTSAGESGAICASCPRIPAGGTERSSTYRERFQRQHPCPSTGKTSGECPGYVVDHVKPLKRGGADDPSNMQWQTIAAAQTKDRFE